MYMENSDYSAKWPRSSSNLFPEAEDLSL